MKIIIAPLHQGYFSGRLWMGLDPQKMKAFFHELNFPSDIIPFEQLIASLDSIEEQSVIFYSSTYNASYLQYIKDVVITLKTLRPDLILLPDFNQLNALENKGYQELYKKALGIKQIEGKYYGDITDYLNDDQKFAYPFVLKKNEGALSSGVFLMKKEEDMQKFIEREQKETLKRKIAYSVNKRNSFKGDKGLDPNPALLEDNFKNFFSKRSPFVVQKFVPGLTYDFKVLVFGDKFYALQRQTRENDFRASGSGKFSFVEAPKEVLDYAQTIAKKFNVPFISLDIGIDKDFNCYLFEFQGTAFGPLTLTKSPYYYQYDGKSWNKIEAKSNLEKEYVNAIIYFLKHKNENS